MGFLSKGNSPEKSQAATFPGGGLISRCKLKKRLAHSLSVNRYFHEQKLCTPSKSLVENSNEAYSADTIHLLSMQSFPKNQDLLLYDQEVRNVSFSENFAYVLNGWFLCQF